MLLFAVTKNPAMLLYLDPNQLPRTCDRNFSREWFELFTLGEGHYTETDIKQVARAFTGWHVDIRTGAFRVERRRYNGRLKTVSGKSGPLAGDDILSLTLEQPQIARYFVRKLWREFISDTPVPLRLSGSFRQNYDIATLLNDLLLTPHFEQPRIEVA
jgi:uncharacterized protein (DUF1800 family)